MRKINTSEENNQYYQIVNKYIDEYMDHRIKPSNLRKYFENSVKLDSFLKKYKLEDIDGIKRIVHDVIEDRWAAEKDGIMKFESFILNEDIGKITIKESEVSYEKLLADFYHTSVGHISVIDEKEHKYLVEDFGKEKHVVVYTSDDVADFKKSLIPILLEKVNTETIDLHRVDLGLKSSKQIKCGINFSLDSIISSEKLNQMLIGKLDEKKLIEIITNVLNDFDILRSSKIYRYSKEFKGSHIWELENR